MQALFLTVSIVTRALSAGKAFMWALCEPFKLHPVSTQVNEEPFTLVAVAL